MTDFNKVESYYSVFDEWSRLDAPSGKLEFELTLSWVLNHLKEGDKILDLGGGPGRYTISLAELGYEMYLADISKDLLDQARDRIDSLGLINVKKIDKVNAVDLSIYDDESFNVVLLFGPLYHLTNEEERMNCLSEVYRVLKKGGIVIASYIPYMSGAIGIVDRFFYASSHVDCINLDEVFQSGIFRNNASKGFQEGYYPKTSELELLFERNDFNKRSIRSVRGFGFKREEEILKLKIDNKKMYNLMIKLINDTASETEIIETNGHALYIGEKV